MKKYLFPAISVVAVLFIGVGFAAWSAPQSGPPGTPGSINSPEPINVGSSSQTKTGSLNVGGTLGVSSSGILFADGSRQTKAPIPCSGGQASSWNGTNWTCVNTGGGYAQASYYGQSSYYAYSQSSYGGYSYGQSSYYSYGQSSYSYGYGQGSYSYGYGQGSYAYAYSQSSYYNYTQSAYSQPTCGNLSLYRDSNYSGGCTGYASDSSQVSPNDDASSAKVVSGITAYLFTDGNYYGSYIGPITSGSPISLLSPNDAVSSATVGGNGTDSVNVRTGTANGAGTDNYVAIALNKVDGNVVYLQLDKDGNDFENGNNDTYTTSNNVNGDSIIIGPDVVNFALYKYPESCVGCDWQIQSWSVMDNGRTVANGGSVWLNADGGTRSCGMPYSMTCWVHRQ